MRDALPGGVAVRDLGEQRLSDLARPERVFQLLAPAVPADFPPLRTLDVLPHNLPLQLTSFVGRERELVAVRAALSTARLVTLTGPGGTGKTRLALQAAADALDAYPEGVWLVELAALADPALVPQAVAAAVGVREEPGRPLPATLTEALRPKRLLLVLDNCEHLLDAGARLADALLRTCPQVTILATSREALGIAGEATWRVPSLSLPDAQRPQPPEALTQYAAVRLFVDRAVAVLPTFRVTNQTAPAVAQICARLDGIPLALELAAARVRVLPPEHLLARLEDRFRLLTGGSRTALARHQTLQGAVDWSYGLLSDEEQTLFRRLAAFAGGWTLEAAEAVCAGGRIGAPEVLELLTRLVDKSLVAVEEQADGTARYRLLETLRQYGRQKLTAGGETDGVQQAHAAHYVAMLAARHEGRDLATWVPRWEREHANLRAALDWWEACGDAQVLLQALGKWQHWQYNGHLGEGRQRVARALAAPGAEAPTAARSAALHAAGCMAMWQADSSAARTAAEERLALDRGRGVDLFGAMYLLARIEMERGDFAGARRRLEEGLRELPTARTSGHWLAWLGAVLLREGELGAARARCEESLARFRAIAQGRPTPDLALALDKLTSVAYEQGDLAAARACSREALLIRQGMGDKADSPNTLEGFAALAVAEGRPVRALRLAGAAAAARRAVGRAQSTVDRDVVERRLARARRALTPEEAASAWREGEAMPLEDALADALDGAQDTT